MQLGQRAQGAWSRDLLLNFGTSLYLQNDQSLRLTRRRLGSLGRLDIEVEATSIDSVALGSQKAIRQEHT